MNRPVALLFAIALVLTGWAQQYSESNDFSYALKLYNEGFYDVAAQQFSTFINRYPASDRQADARYYYADALYKLEDLDNARIEFQALAVGYPEHSRAAQGWLMTGQCYEEAGNPEEAAKAYETVKILYPESPLAPTGLLRSAEMYMAVERYERSEQRIREFLDRYLESADYPRGRLLYGRLLTRTGQLERAAGEFERVAEITKEGEFLAEARLGQAEVYSRLGLVNRAQTVLSEAVTAFRGTEAAYRAVVRLARLYQDNRRYEEALQWSIAQVHQLHAQRRMDPPRDNISSGFYRFEFGAFRDKDGVPAELALEHPFSGLGLSFIDLHTAPGNGATQGDHCAGLTAALQTSLRDSDCAMSLCLAPQPLPEAVPAYVPRVADEVMARRRLLLHFFDAPPQQCWQSFTDSLSAQLLAHGIADIVYAAPFIPTIPGTDTYVDEI